MTVKELAADLRAAQKRNSGAYLILSQVAAISEDRIRDIAEEKVLPTVYEKGVLEALR